MTIWHVFTLMGRYRALAAVMVLAVGAGMFWAAQPEHVYLAKQRVVLLAPVTTPGNALVTTTASLVGMTGVVARQIGGFEESNLTVDAGVSLASQGVMSGYAMRQPNAGGQWDIRYEEPVLDVQATGASPDSAAATLGTALDEINSTLAQIQDEKTVPARMRIRVQLSPARPVITLQSGSRIRAVAASGLIGLLALIGVMLGADALAQRVQGAGATPEPGRAPAHAVRDRDALPSRT